MIQKISLLFIFILSRLVLPAHAGQDQNPVLSVRILEKQNLQELEVQSPANGGVWNRIKLTRSLLSVNGKAETRAVWGSYDSTVKIKTANLTRIYPGQVNLYYKDSGSGPEIVILNQLNLDDYVACVTAFESGHDRSQPEYLKALAVVVRAYAVSHRRRHLDYDLCDLSHCQVYQGLPPHFNFWRQIAQAGADFKFPASVDLKSLYFHRCCGGVLESADQIWGGAPSPSRTGPDELNGKILCQADSFFHWTSSTEAKNIESTLKTMVPLPPEAALKNFSIVEKTTSGRNKTMAASFDLPDGQTQTIRENALRFESEFGKRYGWRVFPSDWFDMKQENGTFYFTGRGFGHGVGLCQSGALKLAQLGWNWERILGFYFPLSDAASIIPNNHL